jgi:hypothetical protein
VRADTLKPFSNEIFDESVARLEEFARERPRFVLQEIAKLGRTP